MNYPLFRVYTNERNILANLSPVLSSGFLNEGVSVTAFKNLLSDYFQQDNIVPLNSCTSALTLALKLSGVDSDSEVITTSMTCVASNTPIHSLGAKVVWADIDHRTGNISVDDVRRKITNKTRAVLCVDWAGLPCELNELHSLCKDYGIKLIQDAAHAFGATYQGKSICHFSDFTCYSFQAIKHLTCGDGGALVCLDDDDFDRAKRLKWFGIDREATKDENGEWKGQRWDTDIVEAGYKFHMNNISASIGISNMSECISNLDIHRKNAQKYSEHFSDLDFICPLEYPKDSNPSHWVYTAILHKDIDRDALVERLNGWGINAGLVHTPNHYYTCFRESLCDLPETEYFHSHQVSLPCGWWMDEDDVSFIVSCILDFVNYE